MTHAVTDGHAREHYQRRDLDDVDGHVNRRGAIYTAESDVPHPHRKNDAEQPHEQRAIVRAAEGARPELAGEIPGENRRHPHHAAGIDPVVEMAGPAGKELRYPCELIGLGLGKERLLRIEVRGSGPGEQLRQFRVADRRGEAQQQRR